MNSTGNLFLSSLTPASRTLVERSATPVVLSGGDLLLEGNGFPGCVYFLESGVACQRTVLLDGSGAPVGMTGCEGVIGSTHLLGDAVSPTIWRMQVAGKALRVRRSVLQHMLGTAEEIRERILALIQVDTFSMSQTCGCHLLHEARQRLARMLLIIDDRTPLEQARLSHDALATLLSTRRNTVSDNALRMKQEGLLAYHNGRIVIHDRTALEQAACECYGIQKRLFNTFYAGKAFAGPA